MAFFENLKKKAEVVMDKGTDKAKDLAELTKLNRNISMEEKKINQAYLELGKIYFEKEKDNAADANKELMDKIKVSMASIAEMRDQIAAVKNKAKAENVAEDTQAEAAEETVAEKAAEETIAEEPTEEAAAEPAVEESEAAASAAEPAVVIDEEVEKSMDA